MYIVAMKHGSVEWAYCVDAESRDAAIADAKGMFPEAEVLGAAKEELEPGSLYHRFI